MSEPDPDDRPSLEGRTATGMAGFVAGVAGAAVALGFGELVEGVSETIPSLVVAVAEVVVDYTPGDVVAFSIANIGSAQKTLLVTGVVVVSLAVCGILGRLAARGGRLAAVGGFALFGLVGGWAAARNPQSPAGASWLVALAAAVLAAATTIFLVHRAGALSRPASAAASAAADADEEGVAARSPERVRTRRSFFGFAAGAAIAALGLVGLGRGLRGESAAEQAREAYSLPSRDPAPATDQGTALGEPQPSDAVTAPSVADTPTTTQGTIDTGGAAPTTTQAQQSQATETEQPAPTTTQAQQSQATETEQPAPTTTQAQQSQATETEQPAPTTTQAQQTQATETQQPAPTTTQPPEPAPTTTQPPEPAPTTTQPPEPAPTTTQPPEPAPTTTQPPEPAPTTTQPPEPAPTTTQPPEPAPTTTQPPEPAPTTTQPPSNLPVQEQLARIDTLDNQVPGISAYITPITPTDKFYRIDTAVRPPQVNPANWRLRFTGMVDRPYELTFDDILAMDLSDHVITLSCVSNPVGGQLVGNAVWTGVPLAVLLERAGAQSWANQVVGRSVDDFTAGFPIGAVHDGRNAILAIGMNDELLPISHGFPARLVVAGLYGYVSAVKWLEEIHLTTWDGFDGYWVPRGWSKRGPIKTQSRIDTPRSNARLRVGETTSVAGIAWAPTRGIERVETKIGREDWTPCRLGQALGDESWVQWHREWTPAKSGTHRIQVRATDGNGTTQGGFSVPPRPNGAEGRHSLRVEVRR